MFPPLKLKHLGPYLAHSATNFEHRRMYNYYFAPGAQQTFPSTDASLWENRELTCKKKKAGGVLRRCALARVCGVGSQFPL